VIDSISFHGHPATISAWPKRVYAPRGLHIFRPMAHFLIITGAGGDRNTHGGPITSIDGLLCSTTDLFHVRGFPAYQTQGNKADQIGAVRAVFTFKDSSKTSAFIFLELFAELPNDSSTIPRFSESFRPRDLFSFTACGCFHYSSISMSNNTFKCSFSTPLSLLIRFADPTVPVVYTYF
jgi:hypothetical protein